MKKIISIILIIIIISISISVNAENPFAGVTPAGSVVNTSGLANINTIPNSLQTQIDGKLKTYYLLGRTKSGNFLMITFNDKYLSLGTRWDSQPANITFDTNNYDVYYTLNSLTWGSKHTGTFTIPYDEIRDGVWFYNDSDVAHMGHDLVRHNRYIATNTQATGILGLFQTLHNFTYGFFENILTTMSQVPVLGNILTTAGNIITSIINVRDSIIDEIKDSPQNIREAFFGSGGSWIPQEDNINITTYPVPVVGGIVNINYQAKKGYTYMLVMVNEHMLTQELVNNHGYTIIWDNVWQSSWFDSKLFYKIHTENENINISFSSSSELTLIEINRTIKNITLHQTLRKYADIASNVILNNPNDDYQNTYFVRNISSHQRDESVNNYEQYSSTVRGAFGFISSKSEQITLQRLTSTVYTRHWDNVFSFQLDLQSIWVEGSGGLISFISDPIKNIYNGLNIMNPDGFMRKNIEHLIIPPDNMFQNKMSEMSELIEQNVPILKTSADIMINFSSRVANVVSNKNTLQLTFPEIKEPFYNNTIVNQINFDFNDYLESIPALKLTHNFYLVFIDIVFLLMVINLTTRKINKMIEN